MVLFEETNVHIVKYVKNENIRINIFLNKINRFKNKANIIFYAF